MFDMGFLELLLIGIIALIVLGPERLPKAARTVGLWIGKAKQGFDSIKTEIDRELKVKELQEQIAEQKLKLKNDLNITDALDIKDEFSSIKDDISQTVNKIHQETSSIGTAYHPLEEGNRPLDKTANPTSNTSISDNAIENKKPS